MDAYQYVINNLTSQTFLELIRFQKSWSLTGRDQNWTCLVMPDRNQAKRPTQYRCWKLKLFDVQKCQIEIKQFEFFDNQ